MAFSIRTPDDDHEADPFKGIALINAVQFAKLLSVSERTLYRLKSSNQLPNPINLGGSVRWRLDDVRRWIDRGCEPPTESMTWPDRGLRP